MYVYIYIYISSGQQNSYRGFLVPKRNETMFMVHFLLTVERASPRNGGG